MYIYPPSIHKREKESKSLSALASLYALIRRLVALCVCSWESGGFQLFKCGYPYLCKTIQLQKAASCRGVPLFFSLHSSILFAPTYISFILPIFFFFSLWERESNYYCSIFFPSFSLSSSRRTYICIKDTYRRVSICTYCIYTFYKQYVLCTQPVSLS